MQNHNDISRVGKKTYTEADHDRALSTLMADIESLTPQQAAEAALARQRETLRLVTDHIERALAVSRAACADAPPRLRLVGGAS
jgi:hypothetical protein